MYKGTFVITSEIGLHARPATKFVRALTKFKSTAFVRNATTKSEWVDAKSILSVLALGIEKNQTMEITIQGEDENQASNYIEKFILNGFNEQNS